MILNTLQGKTVIERTMVFSYCLIHFVETALTTPKFAVLLDVNDTNYLMYFIIKYKWLNINMLAFVFQLLKCKFCKHKLIIQCRDEAQHTQKK